MPSSTEAALPREAQEYLDELRRELHGVPRARRQEIVADITTHITSELAMAKGPVGGGPSGSESHDPLFDVLDRLGPPAEIARAARAELPPARRLAGRNIATIVLLLLGGFLCLVGWVAGAVLLWISDAWQVREKVIGTLIVPGGLATPVLLSSLATNTTAHECVGSSVSGADSTACTTQGTELFPPAVAIGILAVTFVGPIVSAIWLATHARRDVER